MDERVSEKKRAEVHRIATCSGSLWLPGSHGNLQMICSSFKALSPPNP